MSIWCVNWTEYERGWGSRPDGHTLHLTKESAEKYIENHWEKMPKSYVPDLYSKNSKPFEITATEEELKLLSEKDNVWGHVSRWRGDHE